MWPLRNVASLAARPGLAPRSCIARWPPLSIATAKRATVDHGRTRRLPGLRAWESSTAGTSGDTSNHGTSGTSGPAPEEKDSGHIAVKSNESILFFDNIFPLKLNGIISRPGKTDGDVSELLARFENSHLGIMDPIRLVKNAIPEDLPIKVTEIWPRLKDGGAYVKFRHDASVDPYEIEENLGKRLSKKNVRPWFNPFRSIHARLVRGTPWLEDLYRYPTQLVRVEFVPPEPGTSPEELSEEMLYSLFRRYGKIADIRPQPFDSKVTPKYAQIIFPLMRDAVMARNCMHGYVVSEAAGGGKGGTKLRLSYEKRIRAHTIWNWLTSHPRIVIPLIAALIATVSVIIFDPIRQMFIKIHVQHSFKISESRIYKWFKAQTYNFSFGRKRDVVEGLDTVWKHRRDLIDQLKDWVNTSSDTFIVVTGPRGSGKVQMVMDQSLEGRKDVLMIDCRPIVEARGEAGTMKKLAQAVGYRPMFSWANSMSSMIDLAVTSTTGVKAGFSETLESQVTKILQTTAAALREVALSERSKKDSDANLSDDAFLESHPELRPVVVIDNYLHKNEESGLMYDKIAEWAASVVQNNVAHVIFLTNDAALKPLTKALPDRVFRTIPLGDLDPEVAKNYVVNRVEEQSKNDKKSMEGDGEKQQPIQPNLNGLEDSIATLGGRLTDLEFLARRLKTGQSPKQAIEEIVDESATDIVKMFLLGKVGESERAWSQQQAWYLVKSLAENPSLRYNQVLLSPTFSSSLTKSASNGEAALDSLASSELISITFHQGRPQTIHAGKPLHQAAFGLLLKDRVLRAKMDLALLTETCKVEAKSIETVEQELAVLGSLPRQTGETAGRINYLLGKLESSQKTIAKLDKDMAGLKRILNDEY